jgi:hypothetical protein
MQTIAPSLACFLLAAVVGCAAWFVKGEPPEVLVTNITPADTKVHLQRCSNSTVVATEGPELDHHDFALQVG